MCRLNPSSSRGYIVAWREGRTRWTWTLLSPRAAERTCGRGRPLSDDPSSRFLSWPGSTLGEEEAFRFASMPLSPHNLESAMNHDDLSELKSLRKRVLDLRGFL
jgi:hypothetical protein